MTRKLDQYEVDLLDWMYKCALEWRGEVVGHPDPGVVMEYDERLKDAKALVDYLKS